MLSKSMKTVGGNRIKNRCFGSHRWLLNIQIALFPNIAGIDNLIKSESMPYLFLFTWLFGVAGLLFGVAGLLFGVAGIVFGHW